MQQELIVVLHFCSKDWHLAEKNLQWCLVMGEALPVQFDCVLAYDTNTPREAVAKIKTLADRYFRRTIQHEYDAPFRTTWPQGPNWAFQKAATFVSENLRQPWFWWEADAVPLRKHWLGDLAGEYFRGLQNGKVFMGHIVEGMGHMNGVGIYPGVVGRYSRDAMLANNAAWDVVMSKKIMNFIHRANHLIQHVWAVDENGNATNGAGKEAVFTCWRDVAQPGYGPDFRCAIYHRCKNGSLQDVLIANTCDANLAKHYVAPSEPHDVAQNFDPAKVAAIIDDAPEEVPGDVGILIVTYHKDFPWLEYCLRAIDKHCKGFKSVFMAIPGRDSEAIMPVVKKFRHHSRIKFYDEIEGKGFVQHAERIGCADQICQGMDYILHIDADCIFKMPTTPGHYFKNGKPVMVCRTYDSLWDSARKVVSDCFQWKAVAERMLGEKIEMYTMCRHPSFFPKGFYLKFRQHVERVQGKSFLDWHLEQKNSFPQTTAEFPAMGAWAYKHMHDSFSWIDVSNGVGPKDRLQDYWSHGGLDQMTPRKKKARDEIEEFLK